jgi:hypothetical protein
MVIELQRSYKSQWTEGIVLIKDVIICRSIELRWANNERNVSCVPEGVYPVAIINHPKFGECLIISNVEKRSGILMHTANDAQKELRGCIAPVFALGENGKGQHSRLALGYIIENLKRSGEREHFIDIKKANLWARSLID